MLSSAQMHCEGVWVQGEVPELGPRRRRGHTRPLPGCPELSPGPLTCALPVLLQVARDALLAVGRAFSCAPYAGGITLWSGGGEMMSVRLARSHVSTGHRIPGGKLGFLPRGAPLPNHHWSLPSCAPRSGHTSQKPWRRGGATEQARTSNCPAAETPNQHGLLGWCGPPVWRVECHPEGYFELSKDVYPIFLA